MLERLPDFCNRALSGCDQGFPVFRGVLDSADIDVPKVVYLDHLRALRCDDALVDAIKLDLRHVTSESS